MEPEDNGGAGSCFELALPLWVVLDAQIACSNGSSVGWGSSRVATPDVGQLMEEHELRAQ